MADMHMPHVASGSKIGKHSVWLWGGVLAGVVVIYVYYSRSSGGSAAASTAPAMTTTDGALMGATGGGTALPTGSAVSSGGGGPSGGVDSTGGIGGGGGGGDGTYTDPGVDPTADPGSTDPTDTGLLPTDPLFSDTPPPDNFTWEGTAVSYLIKHGVSGINAQKAVESYLNGQTMTYQQATWLNGVIANSGIAPEGVANTPTYLGKPKPHVAGPKLPTKPAPTHSTAGHSSSGTKHSSAPVKHSSSGGTKHSSAPTKHHDSKPPTKHKIVIKRKHK